MKLLLTFFLATVAPSIWAQEQRANQIIPAKAYHVILYPDTRYDGAPRVIGRIPASENMEIQASADAITSGISVTLTGKAKVTVAINGKPTASYEGVELILTPVATASEPLTYQDVSAKLMEFDAAIARRDMKTGIGFFAEDAKISMESLTTTGVQTKSLSREEYIEHWKAFFPTALRITVDNSSNPPQNNGDEGMGCQMMVSKDGISATGTSNVGYLFTIPEGQMHLRINRKLTVEKRGTAFVITSMDVTIPKWIKENWPDAKPNPFGRPPQPPRAILPR